MSKQPDITFSYTPDKTVKIIFDTDMDTDVDDVGALAVLYSYVQEGRAEVLATVGSCNSGCAVKCIGGINAYYGFSEVPVGISPECPSSGKSSYQSVIAERYGQGYPDDKRARPAVEVYREVLAAAEDNSVVITVIGALNNLCGLLKSKSDKYSPLYGIDLVRQKVKICVIMGGRFPKSASVGEYNIRLDVAATYYVIHNCPVSILWSGQEIGDSIFTGNMRNEMEEDNPVRLAYNLYGNDETGTFTRESWDLTTIVYAVEGAGDYWDIQTGLIEVNTDGKILVPDYGPAYNNWTAGAGKDAILLQKMNPEEVARMLNNRMTMAKKSHIEGDDLYMDDRENKAEMFALSDNKYMSFEECFDNLKFTRDFNLYLDVLNCLKNKYLIILSIKDISSQNLSNALLEKIHNVGFSNYKTDIKSAYVGIINSGNVIYNEFSLSAENPVLYDGIIGDIKIFVSSKLPKLGNKAEIIIDSEDYSLNEKGLNFVVYDCEKQEVVDSSGYDLTVPKPTFYHRNLFFDDKYINSHFYMPKIHLDEVTQPVKRSYFSNRQLNVREVDKGIILPNKTINGKEYGGVCDKDYNFISGHQLFSMSFPNYVFRHIYGGYAVSQDEIEYVDETVVYGGTLLNHPGHLIVECFADRIWWLAKNPESTYKIAVVTIWENRLLSSEYISFVKEYLYAFGLKDDKIIFVKKPTQFKKVIVPDQSSYLITFDPYEFTSEYMLPFRQITRDLPETKYKKVYLSKKQTAKKNIIGEDYFIDFFKKRGFEIVNPEEHTIKEKAEILHGADEVVSVDGTNVLFSVFCKPSVRLTVLSKHNDRNWQRVQQLITEAAGIKEFYLVNVSGTILDKTFATGLMAACVTEEFKNYVRDVYHEELEITTEESKKNSLYEYFSYVPEYFSVPHNFNNIKNHKMLFILQNISEVFLGKEFDTSKLDLSTNESNLQKQVNDLKGEKNKLNAQIATLTGEKKEYKESIDKLTGRLQLESEAVKSAQGELVRLEKELDECHIAQDIISQLKDACATVNNYKESVEQIEALKEKISQMDLQLCELRNSNEQLYTDKERLSEEIQRIDHLRKLSDEERLKLSMQYVASVKENTDLQNRMQSMAREKEKLDRQIQDTLQELADEQGHVSTLRHEYETSCLEMQSKLNEAKKEIDAKDEHIDALYASHSWKITKPLRAISSAFKGN